VQLITFAKVHNTMPDWVTYVMGIVILGVGAWIAIAAYRQHYHKVERITELAASRQAEIVPAIMMARIHRVMAEVVTKATGVEITPEQLRLEDRLDSDLHLGLDSLSYFELEAGLSKEFGFPFKLGHHSIEPTIQTIIVMVTKQLNTNG
jgi:acyl carrier protein